MYAYFIFNAYPMTRALQLLKALSWIYFPFISCVTNPFPRPTLAPPPPAVVLAKPWRRAPNPPLSSFQMLVFTSQGGKVRRGEAPDLRKRARVAA